jgi:mono/diheme cytochrome c family protein
LRTSAVAWIPWLGIVAALGFAGVQDPPPAPDVIALGRQVFEGKQGGAICFTCHGFDGKGVRGLGPNLTDAAWLHGDGSLAFIEDLVKSGVPRAKESAAPMPPMGGGRLDATQLRAVAAYVYSLSHRR